MDLRCLFGLAYLKHGPDDLIIAGTAAEVAGQPVADTPFVGVGLCVKQRLGGQQESRGADAALERGILQERLLYRMKSVGSRSELHLYKDAPHGFFNKGKKGNHYPDTIAKMDKFLASLGYLKGEPTIRRPD
jgi:hypothetical protein